MCQVRLSRQGIRRSGPRGRLLCANHSVQGLPATLRRGGPAPMACKPRDGELARKAPQRLAAVQSLQAAGATADVPNRVEPAPNENGWHPTLAAVLTEMPDVSQPPFRTLDLPGQMSALQPVAGQKRPALPDLGLALTKAKRILTPNAHSKKAARARCF